MDELIKERLNNQGFLIERELGRGGFGITYLTADTNNSNKLFVIKTIKDELLQHIKSDKSKLNDLNTAIKSFRNEANVLFKCQHNNIVKFCKEFSETLELSIDSSSDNTYPLELWFLVVEYIEGQNLKQVVEKRGSPLSEAEALSYIQQIGQALVVIHEKSLLHRDIKPQNIMVRQSTNDAVLIDFGIAREFIPEITQSHTQIGTDPYAPPEQIIDRRGRRGCYTDIYSLAATLYYLLTTKLPKNATYRLLFKDNPLPEPQEFNSNISDRVNQAILWGMELEPSKRPQKVEDWLNQLLPQPTPSDDLSSDHNVDYTRLRDFLRAGQWKEADEETFAVMLKASGRETEGWLSSSSIENFLSTDLRTIDQLWVKYSNGRFGFSVQKRIWESVGKDDGKFGDAIGWRKGSGVMGMTGWLNWINYKDVQFTNAPLGHLPSLPYLNALLDTTDLALTDRIREGIRVAGLPDFYSRMVDGFTMRFGTLLSRPDL